MSEEGNMLADIAGGDEEAMRRFFNQFADDIYRYIVSHSGDSLLASDIQNQVMLEVWRRPESFLGRSKVTTWLIAIARHKLIDHYRRERRHRHDELSEATIDPAPMTEHLVSAAQNAAWLKHCIDLLGRTHREIVHLVFYADMAYAEIAEIVECPVGTVKSRMFSARKALRGCLEKLSAGDANAFY